MSQPLNLMNFAADLDELALMIDSSATSPEQIVEDATEICSGVSALSLFPVGGEEDLSIPWEGYLEENTLTVYSATHQMVFSLEYNALNSAVLSGPEGINWKISCSEKGTHVVCVDFTGQVYSDILIAEDGEVSDPRDISAGMEELKQELEEMSDVSEDELPAYVPDQEPPDINLPEIDDLSDVSTGAAGGDLDDDSDIDDSDDDFDDEVGGTEVDDYEPDSSSFNDSSSSGGSIGGGAGFSGSSNLKRAAGVMAGAAAAKVASSFLSGKKDKQTEEPTRPEPQKEKKQADKPEKADKKDKPELIKSDKEKSSKMILKLRLKDKNEIEIDKFPCIIGRSPEVDLTLNSRAVSRKHAQFIEKDKLIWLKDLGSSNGTFFEKEKVVEPLRLAPGFKIRFADVEVEVVSCPEPEPPDPGKMKTVALNMGDKLKEAQDTREIKKSESRPEPEPKSKPKPKLKTKPEPVKKAPEAKPAAKPAPPPPPKPQAKPKAPEVKKTKTEVCNCSNCGAVTGKDAKFCPECGNPMNQEKHCPSCGVKCEKHDKFCPECGTRVDSAGGAGNKKQQPAAKKSEKPAKSPPPPPPAQSSPGPKSSPKKQKSSYSPPPPPPSPEPSPAKPENKPVQNLAAKNSRRQPEAEDNEYSRRISSDDDSQSLPSVRWVSFVYGIFLLIDTARIIDNRGDSVFDDIGFLRTLGAGLCTILFAFIAGSSKGVSRNITLGCAAFYLGSKIYSDFGLFSALVQNPAMIEKNSELIIPVLAVLGAAWLVKRAARR
jgi:pSer/pThr/pTyr-binding forkhead associated (FHA) protein/RNA polymerase subunit RPABC4/transcription elongation factor Spt4